MACPFPGMDPYIEANGWGDFHFLFLAELRRTLGSAVGPDYYVRASEYVYLVPLPGEKGRFIEPDNFVVAAGLPDGVRASNTSAAILEAPVTLELPPLVQHRQRFLQVLSQRDEEVVTVLELLSPSNKHRGPDHDQYLARRSAVLAGPTHLVEIDLLRGGTRLPMRDPLPTADFYVVISKADERPRCGVWPFELRDRLPTIPIPLRSEDGSIPLNLQAAFERTYEGAGYSPTLRRDLPLVPPLTEADSAWARQCLLARGVA